MTRQIQTFTVRLAGPVPSGCGNLVGTFGARTAKEAIRAAIRSDRINGSQFRRYTFLRPEQLVAAVEGRA